MNGNVRRVYCTVVHCSVAWCSVVYRVEVKEGKREREICDRGRGESAVPVDDESMMMPFPLEFVGTLPRPVCCSTGV